MIPRWLHDAPPVGFARRVALAATEDLARAERIETVMINIGLRCNTSCEPCHHGCSPSRSESMSAETLARSLELIRALQPGLVDVTGGEPALWPLLRDLVLGVAAAHVPRIRVRTNLTGLLAPGAEGIAGFLAERRVEILASLPASELPATDPRLRSLALLRDLGYGDGADGSAALDIAHIPHVGRPSRPQADVQREFRASLAVYDVTFRSLFEITGAPLGGFAAALGERDAARAYRAELRSRFNPAVLPLLDCRRGIEIAWDGTLWDCDFNLAAKTPLAQPVRDIATALGDSRVLAALSTRRIAFGPHCFACAAGAGSG
jgi:radical SAM/Cys-rich protein